MTEHKEKMEKGDSFSMKFQNQGVKMDHAKTQRMKLTKRRQAKRKKEVKNQRRMFPIMVTNFVIGKIGKCRHKPISLTSTRS
jgi:hypothetical protein